MKKCSVLFCLFAVFSFYGCSAAANDTETADAIIARYAAADTISADVDMICDNDGFLQQYGMTYTYSASGEDHAVITAPEEIRGISLTYGEEVGISFDLTELETGFSEGQGISPADALPVLMDTLIKDNFDEVWTENSDAGAYLVLQYADEEDNISRTVYFQKDSGDLKYFEVYQQGNCLLKTEISNLSIT